MITLASNRYTIVAYGTTLDSRYPQGGAGGFTPESGFGSSGASAHAELFTVTSSAAFGSHADYNPNAYTWNGHQYLCAAVLDFEDGLIQKDGFSFTTNTFGTFSEMWQVDATSPPAGLTKSAIRKYPSGGTLDERGALEWHMPESTGTLYATFKMRVVTDVRSGKFFRVYYSTSNGYCSTGISDSASTLSLRYISNESTETTEWSSFGFTPSQWSRFECVTIGGSTMQCFIDGQIGDARTGVGTLTTTNSVDLGNMVDNASRYTGPLTLGNEYRYADVIYDLTQARFELADAAVWASRTRSEMQIPVSWTASSVQLALNKGEHSAIAGKYLYFISSAGSATLVGQFGA